MKKITLNVNEVDIKDLCAFCEAYVKNMPFDKREDYWMNKVNRIRSAIAFALINPGKVLDSALKGTQRKGKK